MPVRACLNICWIKCMKLGYHNYNNLSLYYIIMVFVAGSKVKISMILLSIYYYSEHRMNVDVYIILLGEV